MRTIKKGAAPAKLTNWLGNLPAGYLPGWTEIPSDAKSELKQSLLREQFFICCYCERRADMSDSHIEHLNSQGKNSDQRYDYGNLLASCQGESQRGKAPQTCGHVRGEEVLPVHPLMLDCGDYFIFSSSGVIGPDLDPSRQAAARETIRILKLDSSNLNQARKAALSLVDDQLLSIDDADELQQEARNLLSIYSVPDEDGRLSPFISAIEQHLRSFL